MNIIEPWIQIENYNGTDIMKNIEKACRTCYRSENLINEESYKTLLRNCLNKGHQSILEHEKITVRLCCDIGTYKDLTRHRFASFSIESTRYCNYGKDKFNNQINFIKPIFYNDNWIEDEKKGLCMNTDEFKSKCWYKCMENIEKTYIEMTKMNCTPDEMRMILPHSTAAEVTMTCNIREWRHIFELRAQKMSHPAVQQIMIPLLLKFQKDMPELFGDIQYNNDFSEKKYAKILPID